jgi:hypothetical protein
MQLSCLFLFLFCKTLVLTSSTFVLIVVSDEDLKRRVAEELALEQAKKESEHQRR